MGDRPLMNAAIDELEELFRRRNWDTFTLSRLREELTYRSTERAKRLRREVEGILSGQVPRPPRPAADDGPESQTDLLKH
ncbi:MAG: hypothetical protein AB7S39_13185 [Gemmatimonadales bacterium]